MKVLPTNMEVVNPPVKKFFFSETRKTNTWHETRCFRSRKALFLRRLARCLHVKNAGDPRRPGWNTALFGRCQAHLLLLYGVVVGSNDLSLKQVLKQYTIAVSLFKTFSCPQQSAPYCTVLEFKETCVCDWIWSCIGHGFSEPLFTCCEQQLVARKVSETIWVMTRRLLGRHCLVWREWSREEETNWRNHLTFLYVSFFFKAHHSLFSALYRVIRL